MSLYTCSSNLIICSVNLQFFAEAGFPCPTRRNPSDHFLQCINSDFDVITEILTESQRICVCM